MKKILLLAAALFTATFTQAQTELLTNGGFENWTNDVANEWKSTTTASNGTVTQSTDAHSGNYAIRLANATSNKRLASKELNLKAGTYTFSFYVKAASAENSGSTRPGYAPWAVDKLGTYQYGDYTNDITTEWQQISYEFTLDTITQINLVVMNPKSTDTHTYADLIIDDASLTTTDGGLEDGDNTGGSTDTPTEGAVTIAQAHAAAANTLVTVDAQVVALSSSGAVLADNTGYIYHFVNAAPTYKVGDNISITGKLSAYGGFNQFSTKNDASTTFTVKSNSAVTYPTPTVMTGAEMDEWVANPEIDYVQFTGKLNISGNYYNVSVEGATKAVGSLAYPTDAIKEKLANGNEYVFTGFAMYQSGSNKYLNLIVTDVKPVGEIVVLKDISNTLETAYSVEKCVELINDEGNDLSKKVYIRGIISEMGEGAISTDFGNASFNISSDGTTTSQQFKIYRGYWFNGEKFTSADQLKVGDEVVYLATMTKYVPSEGDPIYETNQGGELILLNGTNAIQGINADKTTGIIYDLQGRRVSKALKGIYIINGKKVVK